MTAANSPLKVLEKALENPGLSDAMRNALLDRYAALLAGESTPVEKPEPKTRAPKPVVAKSDDANRIALNKTNIAAMPFVEKGERLVFDMTVPQLAVRIRQTKKVFVVLMWDKERQRKVIRTLGDVNLLTPDQARRQAQEVIGLAATGGDIRKSTSTTMSFAEIVDQWHLTKHKTVRTADEIKSQVLRYLGALAKRDADKITREDIGRIHRHIATEARRVVYKRVGDQLVESYFGEPGLPATADKFVAYVRTIYQWANEQALCATNPAKGLKHSYDMKRSKRTRYLHGDELVAFWSAMEADHDADTRDVLKMLLFTGQRRGNVLTMRWADIDLTAGIWSVGADQTKQAEAQSSPLVGQALEILVRRYESASTQWVFPATRMNADGSISAMSEARLRDAWMRILAAAGIENLRIHDLRHTSGSWLARLGVSERIRQKALGHKTPAMSARYAHLELEPVSDAMQRVADTLVGQATKPAAEVRKFKGRAVKHG